jgi:hypothetical protein
MPKTSSKPSKADSARVHSRIKALLFAGLNATATARKVHRSHKRVREIAIKNGWPLNAPIRRGGARERQLQSALDAGLSPQQVCAIFRLAPKLLSPYLKPARK